MRLIAKLDNQAKGYALSNYLNSKGVEAKAEVVKNLDWGSDNYGSFETEVFILKEDQLERGLHLLNEFIQEENFAEVPKESIAPLAATKIEPSPISFGIIALCLSIFIWSELTVPPHPDQVANPIAVIPLTSAPIKRALLYDWPPPYVIADEISQKFGTNIWEHPQDLPPEGQALYKQAITTPLFAGFYTTLVELLQGKTPSQTGELFYKIRQGEYWRLFTPAFLHLDIFHLFFNMLWVAFLGRMIEIKLKKWRYILFILIAALFSNTAQYLMSGSNFLGFSGVLTAFLGFVYMRQRIAPYEGYDVQPALFTFMAIFIFGLALLQIASFFSEVFYNTPISPGIANTAHISGLLIGLIMGLCPFFRWKH